MAAPFAQALSTIPKADQIAVAVAVATFARPEGIRTLLPLLLQQVESVSFHSWVLVVDNNPQPDARVFVEQFLGPSVRYIHEPVPGISSARNRALLESMDADVIVFIDDDEVPLDSWLATLVEHWLGWHCAAVAGPVVSEFAQRPDEWIVGSGVFARYRVRTGSTLQGAATNNLLLDLKWLHTQGIQFDARFGITGGSDTLLTRQIIRAGGQIRWCDEAEVREIVPPVRSTRRWVIRRTLRTSNDWSRVHLVLATSRRQRVTKRAELI
ncbi:MAG: glycosyltransferase, partial [Chloroflexota bacterium]|nr:glycosyltransferase [Chloroflexota bacterium]